jgi:hypothetical protein
VTTSPDNSRPLRRAEAAEYIRETYNLPCQPGSLRTMAHKGTGPAFRKGSRFPLYSREDLDLWASAKIGPKVRSTSELTAFRATSAPVSP